MLNRLRKIDRLFALVVVLPTLLSILYFGFLSSNVYLSESRFIVRSPEKPMVSGVGMLLKGAGFSAAGDEIFAAQNFVTSRDALRALDRNGAFRKSYGAGTVSLLDRFDPLGIAGSFEQLYAYYQGKVYVEHDNSSSISTLIVRAYNPADAQRFNERLLEMAEQTVNRLNDRAREDLIRINAQEVVAAKQRAEQTALALSAFRNREGVIDPEKQASVQLQMVSKLQDELITTNAQLAQLRSVAPDNPQIGVIRAQARSLSEAIDRELGKVAGDNASLSTQAAQYQHLQLENQFADRQLGVALTALQDAKNDAARKQAYVERIVQPNKPDYPIEPKRWRGILSTLLFSLIVWGVLNMLFAGIREHQQ